MRISVWKSFTVFGIIYAWSKAALADGKITLEEAFNLIEKLAVALGLPQEYDVSEILKKQ